MKTASSNPSKLNRADRLSLAILPIGVVVWGLLALSAPNLAMAAVSKKLSSDFQPRGTGSRSTTVAQTLNALVQPLPERMSALVTQGPTGYKNLRSIMFDPQSKIEMRWRAAMAVGRLGGKLSVPELERAKAADVWELRSAALLSASSFDRELALKWARELMKDKALLVRLTAVQTIANFDDRSSVPYLWSQLESQANFKHGRGLFIRRKIVETLARLESKGSEAKFIALLADPDADLHGPAVQALERITGETVGRPTDQITRRRALWQNWWMSKSDSKVL